MLDASAAGALVGSDILGLVTSGMYDNPLTIYREYIQNTADAFSNMGNAANRKVKVDIDPSALRVRIRDNGPGLSRKAAVRALLPIARSQKQREINRGFRGIGRLSGLAFANSVTFLTRTQNNCPVTRIAWNGPKLRNCIRDAKQTEQAIRECTTIETVSGENYPANFFEVEIDGIGRHAAGLLLNREAVRTHIGEVCPVPIDPTFPFSSEIERVFDKDTPPLTLEVILNGELVPIARPYGEIIRFSQGRTDRFTELERIDIPSLDGKRSAAIGWVAHSSYIGAIPKATGIRGIRARVGNIQVGDETTFDHLFSEERFNRWCVGEIHIVDPRIVPNSRRNYFEPGPHIRNLENQLGPIVRGIAARCRKASLTRNKKRKFLSTLSQIEETHDLATSGYLSPDDAEALAKQALNQIGSIRENMGSLNSHAGTNIKDMDALEAKLRNFKVSSSSSLFGGFPMSKIAPYWDVFQALTKVARSPRDAKDMIEAVLKRLGIEA